MGTGFKGGNISYRSISDNIKTTASKYNYSNGRFGTNSPSTGNKTRNITSNNPVATANDFYSKIANGGSEKIYNNNFPALFVGDITGELENYNPIDDWLANNLMTQQQYNKIKSELSSFSTKHVEYKFTISIS